MVALTNPLPKAALILFMKPHVSVFRVIAPEPRMTWQAAALSAAVLSFPVYLILTLLSWLF